jgi:hypothetical protein
MVPMLLVGCVSSKPSAGPIPMDFDRNCVQFIFTRLSDTNFSPLGTCFAVDVMETHQPKLLYRIPTPIINFSKPSITQPSRYFVTAKHVLFDENGNLRPNMYMRLDNQSGGIVYGYLNAQITNGGLRILTHPDKSVDIAVIGINPAAIQQSSNAAAPNPNLKAKLSGFDSSLIADAQTFESLHITEGHEMFFVGLFTPFYGANENIPICRFGHLSMLPAEPILWGKEGPQRLYLMESEAFGGSSGSPAFFSQESSFSAERISEIKQGKRPFSKTDQKSILFAGVVKGYFRDFSQIMMVNSAVTPYAEQNTGITAIVPGSYLHEILFSKEEREFRATTFKLRVPTGY